MSAAARVRTRSHSALVGGPLPRSTQPAAPPADLRECVRVPLKTDLSRTRCDTASALCALECGQPLVDGTGELAPDVLVLVDPALGHAAAADCETFARSALHHLYLSIAFTRSAALPLPQQHAALLMVAFAKAAEQALRRRGGGLMTEQRVMRQPSTFHVAEATEELRIALAILHTLQINSSLLRAGSEFQTQMATKLLSDEPGAHMTEAEGDGVETVCQLLCLLCLSPSLDGLFATTPEATAQRSAVAMALLAEATSRGCRALLKSPQQAAAAVAAAETRVGVSPVQARVESYDLRVMIRATSMSRTHTRM